MMTQDEVNNTDLHGVDIGCGDPPHVEGGAHFDQQGQYVATQFNIVGDYYAVAPGDLPIPLQRPPRAAHFTGRDAEVGTLLADLHPGRVITLCGPGGVGKTAIAAEAAWTLAPGDALPDRFPDGILSYTFYGRPDIALACEHIIRSYDPTARDTSLDSVMRLLSNKRALLILDGTEEAIDLPALLDVRGACGVLITTRSRRDALDVRRDIVPLQLVPAIELLQAWGGTCVANTTAIGAICEAVGCLPLAVRLAGRYLAQTGETATEYLAWLQTTPLDALDHGQRRLESVPVLLEKSLAQVSAGACDVLGVVGLLALAPFDLAPIAAALDLSESAIRKPLGELVTYGLLLRNEEHYEVTHALIHTYTREHLILLEGGLFRLAVYYTVLTDEQQALGPPGYHRLAAEYPHLLRVLTACAARAEWAAVNNLASALTSPKSFLWLQGYWTDMLAVIETGLAAARALRNRCDEGAQLGNLGAVYHGLGQVERSIECCEQALAIAREIVDRQYEGIHLGNLGSAYHALGQEERAIAYYEQALTIAREIGDRQYEGIHLGNLGNAYHALGQEERAIAYYEQALTIAREIGDREGEGQDLGNLGVVYRDLGQAEKAIAYHEQALAFTREIGDRQNEGNWLDNLGVIYHDLGQVEHAIAYHVQALAIAREIGDRRLEGVTFGNLGNAYRSLGQVEQAIAHYDRALTIAREIGDRRNEGAHLGNLGAIYNYLRRAEWAIAHSEQALAIAREIGDRQGETITLGNLGSTYHALGQVEQAHEYYKQGLAISREIGDRRGEGNHLGSLGSAYHALGQVEQAIEYYKQALAISREIGDRQGGSAYLSALGLAYHTLGRNDEAIATYERVLSLLDSFGTHTSAHTLAWNGLGNVYSAQGRTDEALAAYQKAIALDDKFAYPLHQLGLIYQMQGNLEEALRAYQKAVELSPDEGIYHSSLSAVLRALGRADEAAAHLARARELIPETDLYNRACLEAIAGNPDAALDYLEKALAQSSVSPTWAARDPDLLSLHTHPRFQALLPPA